MQAGVFPDSRKAGQYNRAHAKSDDERRLLGDYGYSPSV